MEPIAVDGERLFMILARLFLGSARGAVVSGVGTSHNYTKPPPRPRRVWDCHVGLPSKRPGLVVVPGGSGWIGSPTWQSHSSPSMGPKPPVNLETTETGRNLTASPR